MPSLSLCDTRVNVYPYVASQDADAGNLPSGNAPAAVASGVWCCAQRVEAGEASEAMGRLSVDSRWLVGFPGDYPVASWGLIPRSRIDVLAADGTTVAARLLTILPIDGGGRGRSWQVECVERA